MKPNGGLGCMDPPLGNAILDGAALQPFNALILEPSAKSSRNS